MKLNLFSGPSALAAMFLLATGGASWAGLAEAKSWCDSEARDEVILLNGEKLRGRILVENRDSVVLLMDDRHVSIDKKEVERIYDRPDREMTFTDLLPQAGHFPPWWVPAYDLFYSDWVKEFAQVPATVIDEGEFQNVPYLSFRANRKYELNVYGNPERPAGLEIGIYGWRRSDAKTRAKLREFITSYLHSIPEIRALESLPDSGGKVESNGLKIEITPPNAPDAYGAWWVSIWYPKALAQARLSPEALAKRSQTLDQTLAQSASATNWTKKQIQKIERKIAADAEPLVYGN
jgi:hypothetical protein